MAAHLAARQHAPDQNGDGHARDLLHPNGHVGNGNGHVSNGNGHVGSGNGHVGSSQSRGAHTGPSSLNGWEK
jgi:hypothetical protein